MTENERTLLTYRYERMRAVAQGVIETASGTFLLLIAVRWFQAHALAKACVASGSGLGLVLTPVVVATVERSRIPVARAAQRLMLVGALALALAAFIPWLPIYVAASMVSIAVVGAIIPLMTQVYQDNYPEHGRGRLFSRAVMLRIATSAAFSFAAGKVLSIELGYFRGLLAGFACAFAFESWCLGRVPSRPLHISGGTHPFRALRFVNEDRVFRQTLISWMLMGFANLMMLPLRIEYLANPKYNLVFTTGTIAIVTGVVPNVARLVMSPLWGWLFDRANFFVLRMALNIGFAIGILSFFTSDTISGLVFAGVMYGVSTAGGEVAWGLWVTKLAPPERVADYMSVHTFFTGVRGLMAPLIGFMLVSRYSMAALGWFSAALIVAGTLVLLPEARRGRPTRRGEPVTQPAPVDQGEP